MQDNHFKYTDALDLDARTSHSMLLSLVGKNERVLEFGCGNGVFAAALRDRLGCTVFGIELSEEACEMAKSNMEKVICCNAESDAWEKELAGQAFDTLILSDVLEHLCDPVSLLRRAARYLREDGKILFSVPNIAHADVIAALMDNRFDYTEKGLLDNTHLRHFAKENLPALFDAAGLFLYHLDATVCESGLTEQNTLSVPEWTRRAAREKRAAFAYQFIGVACHKAYAEKTELSFHSALPPQADGNTVKLFYDLGDGFTAENVATLPSPTGGEPLIYLLPAGTVRLRLSIRPTRGYLIKSTRFAFGKREVTPEEARGILFADEDCLLTEDLSSMTFTVSPEDGVFSFFGEIYAVPAENDAWETLVSLAREAIDIKAKAEALRAECDELRTKATEQNARLAVAAKESTARKEKLDWLQARQDALAKECEALRARAEKAEQDYHTVSDAQFWRITKPLRAVLDFFKRFPPFAFLSKALRYVRRFGIKSAFRRARSRQNEKKASRRTAYTEAQFAEQRRTVFEKDITFSILVPLYNTPKKFLLEMIGSVQAQTYADWELCLADGSDDAHGDVETTCLALAKKDSRIKYKKLEKNLGISGNTNACIDMATGEYIALFDHDDLLHPAALYEFMKAICDEGADFIYSDENTFHDTPKDAYCPHHKPDFAPDTLRTNNYICHFNAFSRELLQEAGGYFRPECDGSQDYDMMLRLTEKAKKIVHIPIILYFWRAHRGSVATNIGAKPYVIEAAHRALADHLKRVGLEGEVLDSVVPSMYRIRYKLKEMPLVSIIIANKDHIDDLDLCLRSIREKTTYPNYEIVIVENNSTEEETFRYYESLGSDPRVHVVTWEGKGFNYSSINNFGVQKSSGKHVLLLNNDIEILSPEWIEEMLMFAQREDVGAVGAKLYYPDDTIQHAGVGIGLLTLAGHYHRNFPRRHPGYMGRLIYAHNVSAVTAACMMIPRRVWEEVEGLDEGYAVAFNDIDLCMKIREKNYLIVFTPFAEAYHYESKSRGLEDTPEKRKRFQSEVDRFYAKWKPIMDKGDPYFNPNFSLEKEDFSLAP